MTKIICISDTHGFLPTDLPEGDILIHAGDFSPTYDHSINFQRQWFSGMFIPYLKKLEERYKGIVFICGNHDFIGEHGIDLSNFRHPMLTRKHEIYYLQDNFVEICGLKIWGTPWQREFYNWAFNLKENELASKWELIPKDTDVVVCHGPAYGYGDAVPSRAWQDECWPEPEHVGSPSMLKKIDEINPKLYVGGHIHSEYGQYKHGEIILVNASLVNEQYKLVNKPIVVEI